MCAEPSRPRARRVGDASMAFPSGNLARVPRTLYTLWLRMPNGGERPGRPNEHALLELIGDVYGLLDIEELRYGMLDSLHRVLPSDYVSLNDVGPTPDQVVAIMKPEVPAMYGAWTEHAHENPLLRQHLATHDGRAYRFSDVISQAEFRELPLYREVYAPMGVEHQMAFTLPGSSDRVLAIALSRGERDYSDAERDFANAARPFLIQSYLNALAHHAARSSTFLGASAPSREALCATGLTLREAEVVRLVALGRSNNHVAAELGISDRTVGKHLEHSFRKLGVRDRSTAAARAWELSAERRQSEAVFEDRLPGLLPPPNGRARA
jgi:DNA-binding CsgD family transcriptional regulator